MDYAEDRKAWLVNYYFRHHLDCAMGGLFRGKPYCHILKGCEGMEGEEKTTKQKDLMKKSLILPFPISAESASFSFDDNPTPIKPHIYAHHLNSSQVFCINYFHPLCVHSRYDILKKLLKAWEIDINGEISVTQFERVECAKEGTNFDFYIETTEGEKVFIEVKYTEREFGKKSSKSEPRRDLYEARFDASLYLKDFKLSNNADNEKLFLTNYQIIRNVSYITSKKEYVLFLYPEQNRLLANKSPDKVLEKIMPKTQNAPNVKIAYSDKVVTDLEKATKRMKDRDELLNYYKKFYEMYFGNTERSK